MKTVMLILALGLAACGHQEAAPSRITIPASIQGCTNLGVDKQTGYTMYQCNGESEGLGGGGRVLLFDGEEQTAWCYNDAATLGPCY